MDGTKKRGGQPTSGAVDPPLTLPSRTSSSLLTASSTSEPPRGTSTDSGRGPGRQSWDPQLNYPPAAGADALTDDRSSSNDYWPRSDTDDSDDEAIPSAASAVKHESAKPTGSRSGRFLRNLMQKFGITFKRYGLIANTKQEQDRNALQHQVILELFDGRYHLAPIYRPRRVLDIGTGPGLWALEFAQRNPNVAVLGIDIERVQPPYQVPNCRFMVMDATEEWNLDPDIKFDFIHVRMLGDLPGKAKIMQNVYDRLSPGGWAEFTEWIVLLQSPNNSFQGTAFQRWNILLGQGLEKLGSSIYYPNEYKSLLRNVGFDRITQTKNAAPTNPCYPGKKLQKVGTMMSSNWKAILDPLTMPVFTSALGWPPEEVKKLVADVKKEIDQTRYHSYMTLLTVIGQKPGERSSSGSASASASVSASASSSSVQISALGKMPSAS